MELITQSMIFLLESLRSFVGSYGVAIIVLTLVVRAVLWPISKSQIVSMKKMQVLQPKMKQIQERYKADPQRMQQEMMKLYKEHKFNPFGGCLPLLVQLPLFLALYGAIANPFFMTESDPTFLHFIHLKHTGIVSHAGPSFNDKMTIASNGSEGGLFGIGRDTLTVDPKMKITLNDDKVIPLGIKDVHSAVTFKPTKMLPGVPVKVMSSMGRLGLEDYEGQIKSIKLNIINTGNKEMETIVFTPETGTSKLATTLETDEGKPVIHWDVLVLVALFGVTMLLSQQMMASKNANNATQQDPQQAMMKWMPLMFTGMLVFFPIPSGVLLYMDTNSLFQIFQTWWFGRDTDGSSSTDAANSVVDIKPDSITESPTS